MQVKNDNFWWFSYQYQIVHAACKCKKSINCSISVLDECNVGIRLWPAIVCNMFSYDMMYDWTRYIDVGAVDGPQRGSCPHLGHVPHLWTNKQGGGACETALAHKWCEIAWRMCKGYASQNRA